MKNGRISWVLWVLPILSCDVSQSTNDGNRRKETIVAPRITPEGIKLAPVDSVRITVESADSGAKTYLAKSVAWNTHCDTIRGIPTGESLLVSISGIKVQADSSVAVWWSGRAAARFPDGGTVDFHLLDIPVKKWDTAAPAIVSRIGDTVEATDSEVRLRWKLREDSVFTASVDGDSLAPVGDSVVWTANWANGRNRSVVAWFRDKTGNLRRDSVELVRRNRVSAPSVSVAGGEYFDTVRVALSDTTPLASILYSLDGGSSWLAYRDPIPLGKPVALFAKAVKDGWTSSSISESEYVIHAAAPRFESIVRTQAQDAQVLRLSTTTPGATIEFALDSEDAWRPYADSIVVTKSATIHARSRRYGLATSDTVSRVLGLTVSPPVFLVPSGTRSWDRLSLGLSSATIGARIQYSFDSSWWMDYRDSIEIGSDVSVWARALKDGLSPSPVASASYFVEVAAPTFSVPDGTSSFDLLAVHLACATPGARIEYSLDSGSTWLAYVDSIVVGNSVRILARATKPGVAASETGISTYHVKIPAPSFSVLPGTTWNDLLTVRIACPTPGATILYSTDRSHWGEYRDSLVLGAFTILQAKAMKPGMATSPVANASYKVGMAPPEFFPYDGTRSSDIMKVAVKSSTPGSSCEYSLDSGTTWLAYRDSIAIGTSIVLMARTTKAGLDPSDPSIAGYVVSLPPPTFSVASRTSWNDLLALKIATPIPGASVQFSLDSMDEKVWSDYRDSIVLGSGAKVWARVVKPGMDPGRVGMAEYTVQASPPKFDVADGTNSNDVIVVRFSSETPGALYDCSLDTARTWRHCADTVAIERTGTLIAKAYKPGLAASHMVAANYVVGIADPVFSVPGGTSRNDFLALKIMCATPGAKIQYSTDNVRWVDYSDSIVLGASTSVWARAMKAGMAAGKIVSAKYWVQTAAPTFSVNSGTRSRDPFAVRVASATPGAFLEYSLDSGSTWIAYKDSILLGRSVDLVARASKPGLAPSAQAAATYDFAIGLPEFSVLSGTSSFDLLTVRLSSATPGASFQYSTDGYQWSEYRDSLVLGESVVLRARSAKPGMDPSSEVAASYVVKAAIPTFSVNDGFGSASPISVRLSSATAGALFEYSEDTGKTWGVYRDSIRVCRRLALQARAYKPGLAFSDVGYSSYNVMISAPTFSVPSGTVGTDRIVVRISSSTEGAKVQYSDDSLAWKDYSDSLIVDSSADVWARATRNDMGTSEVAKAVYTIVPQAAEIASSKPPEAVSSTAP